TVVYAAGLWVGGMIDGNLRVAVAEYSYDYTPGRLSGCIDGASQFINGLDQSEYRVYKINAGDDATNPDYANWPFDQGAPYVDQNENGRHDWYEPPLIIGDQTLFSVYGDAHPGAHVNDLGTPYFPVGIEVQHTTFSFDRTDPLGNVIFIKYKIINKTCDTVEDTYISIWADPDLGGVYDDFVGCDTTLSLGYCYNAFNNDSMYGYAPPAVGFDFIQGPLVPSDNPDDVLVLPDGREFPGKTILDMSSFNLYLNGTDPDMGQETYWYMQGLDAKGLYGNPGGPNMDPTTGQATTFMCPGNPVSGTGWLDDEPSDRRMMLSSGPLTLDPWEDTDGDGEEELGEPGVQELMAAIIVARGFDRLHSIDILKAYDRLAQEAYDNNFEFGTYSRSLAPPPPNVTVEGGNFQINLNWDDFPETNYDDPNFEFEGYNIYQVDVGGETHPVLLATYDLVNGVTVIIQDGEVVQEGTNSGLSYSLELNHDYITDLPLYNSLSYYYAITAYAYNPDPPVHYLESWLAAPIAAIPVDPDSISGTILPVNHAVGNSFGRVEPLVIDPLSLTGHRYEITFSLGNDMTRWHLRDVTLDQFLLTDQENQGDDYNYSIVDGLMIRVIGPTLDFANFEVVANGAGPLFPPEGAAADFAGFPGLQPTVAQQVGQGLWFFHTADNGGTNDGGTFGSYTAFEDQVTRFGSNWPEILPYDYEMRFSGSIDNPGPGGGYAIEWFNDNNVFWVPFELWNIGIGTVDDDSDDYRM
ncbi:MAG: hypothetical protein GY869_19575, partial [Planctomycetes bacterium]|nr:hypothetical protein [Planctomycetota bacterium]